MRESIELIMYLLIHSLVYLVLIYSNACSFFNFGINILFRRYWLVWLCFNSIFLLLSFFLRLTCGWMECRRYEIPCVKPANLTDHCLFSLFFLFFTPNCSFLSVRHLISFRLYSLVPCQPLKSSISGCLLSSFSPSASLSFICI